MGVLLRLDPNNQHVLLPHPSNSQSDRYTNSISIPCPLKVWTAKQNSKCLYARIQLAIGPISTAIQHQVNGEISTIEIPEAEVKKWWGKDEWRVFVQDFQDRHPTVKKLEKATPKSSGTTPSTTPVPRKRSLEVDYSQCVVVEDDAPGSATIKDVGILNARFPADKKSNDLPSLVVSDAGPYIKNSTGFTVPWQKNRFCLPAQTVQAKNRNLGGQYSNFLMLCSTK